MQTDLLRRLSRFALACLTLGLAPVVGQAAQDASPPPTQKVAAKAAAEASSVDTDQLRSAINKMLADKNIRKLKVGICILSLPDGLPLFDYNATTPLMPASNMKVVSTAVAMQLLGPDFHYTTELARRGDDVVVIGAGDPALGDPALTDAAGVPVTWMFDRWAATLEKAGIKTIRNLVVDDSIFEPPAPNPNWPENQILSWYAAEVGGLNFNTNCVDVRGEASNGSARVALRPPNKFAPVEDNLRIGKSDTLSVRRPVDSNQIAVSGTVSPPATDWAAITVHDPGLFFGQALATHLESKGIKITGSVVRERVLTDKMELPPDCQLLARFRTPLWDCLRRANQKSQNLYAECLFKSISAYAPDGKPRWNLANLPTTSAPVDVPPLAQGSWQASQKVVAGYFQQLGIPENEFSLDDGCGLSRKDRVSAHVLAQLLVQAYNSPLREQWLNTLAVSGLAGTTLQKRMTGGGLKGNVLGKTGFIVGVSALSGYVRAPNGNCAAFSVLCNDVPNGGTGIGKDLEDRVARAIYEALQD